MELFDEIWHFIFSKYLGPMEIIRCRRVSRRFKYFADQMRPTELLVYDYKSLTSTELSYRDHRMPSQWIQVYRFELRRKSSFQILFANLRVLQLDMPLGKTSHDEREFNIDLLNRFVRLEELYLDQVTICRSHTLRLPSLKVLSIVLQSAQTAFWHELPRLVLDSKVRRLSCEFTTLLDIRHSECVEVLQCYGADLKGSPPTRFQNLRILRVLYLKSFEWTQTTYECPESLEELHFEPIRRDQQLELHRSAAQRALLREEVKIYVGGVCLPSQGVLEFDYRENHSLADRVRNYHRLTDRVGGVKVPYAELTGWLLRPLQNNGVEIDKWWFPVGFFQKFLIHSVHVAGEVKDKYKLEERLLNFLSRCSRLTEFEIKREHLTQWLLDRLPAACRELKVFTIQHSDCPFLGLNLRPIYALKQLFVLRIESKDAHLDGPLNLRVLFESCRYLVKVELKYIRIEKRKLYHVRIPDEACLASGELKFWEWAALEYDDLRRNLDTIIEECKEMRKRTSYHSVWSKPSLVDLLIENCGIIFFSIAIILGSFVFDING